MIDTRGRAGWIVVIEFDGQAGVVGKSQVTTYIENPRRLPGRDISVERCGRRRDIGQRLIRNDIPCQDDRIDECGGIDVQISSAARGRYRFPNDDCPETADEAGDVGVGYLQRADATADAHAESRRSRHDAQIAGRLKRRRTAQTE